MHIPNNICLKGKKKKTGKNNEVFSNHSIGGSNGFVLQETLYSWSIILQYYNIQCPSQARFLAREKGKTDARKKRLGDFSPEFEVPI